MKILYLMPYSPVPPIFGGALRIYHLLRQSAQYHEVTVVMYGAPEHEERLRHALYPWVQRIHVVPVLWTGRHRRLGQLYTLGTRHSFFYNQVQGSAMQRTIDRVLAAERFDIVQAEFSPMACFRLRTDAVKILDGHNVEYDNFRRMWMTSPARMRRLFYYREYRTMRREELEACRRQDAVFVTSLRDKEILDHDVPDIPKYVVPNGVDMSYFTPSQTTPEPYTLVFTGMMAYVPNYDGMLYFLDEILPRIHRRMPGVRLYIVGNRPPPDLLKRASDRVVVTGYVDDVRPFIHKASVYVVPLRMGSGTRLKILEAMAMKTPIVTTSIGCEGIDVQDGVSVRIEDEPEGFADAVVDLLGNAALRETLIRNGYELVSSRYDWPIIHKTADALYQRLIEGNTVHGPARSVVQYAR